MVKSKKHVFLKRALIKFFFCLHSPDSSHHVFPFFQDVERNGRYGVTNWNGDIYGPLNT